MKRQHRYTHENQIIAEIDRAKIRADELMVEAENLKTASKQSFIDSEDEVKFPSEKDRRELYLTGRHQESEAKKREKSSTRITDIKIPKLGRTLAAFRTEPMVFSDEAVVLQK